jgi:hypothetical protein
MGAAAAAIGSLSVVAIAFLRYPELASGPGTWVAVTVFVAVLTTYVVGAVHAGARLADTRLTLASALAGALIAASWFGFGLNTGVGGPDAVTVGLLILGPAVALTLGWLATTRASSSRVAAGCVGLTAGFALFLLWVGWTVAAAGRPYDAGLLSDFRSSGFGDLATYAVNDSLGTGMVLLVLVPALTAAGGLAAVAAARIKGKHQPR